jgi:hypothetical protein
MAIGSKCGQRGQDARGAIGAVNQSAGQASQGSSIVFGFT